MRLFGARSFIINNGLHRKLGITIRHTSIKRNIALRWSDGTETASVYYSGRRPSVVGGDSLLNSYRVHLSGVGEDTVGTLCLPSVAMPANRALSSVYPLRGKQVRGDGMLGTSAGGVVPPTVFSEGYPRERSGLG